ncbi:MAG: LytR C-terminal domain-containing protein [Ramlibacter sp.]|nr:LytR C-terminal domain-containing protein [Cryobacterium sp.]
MPTSYPHDRFDHLPHHLDRVGAHRAPEKKGRHWAAFWWALAATVLLIGLGVVGLAVLNNNLNFSLPGTDSGTATPSGKETASPAPTPTPAATVDPSLTVDVLNGTAGAGVARAVGEVLNSAGWTVGALSNASTEDVVTTTVYYAEAGLEGAARGVAQSLPGSEVQLATDFAESGGDLTVVVGNDYVPAE